MGLTAKQMVMLFPTGLFTGMLPDITVCDRVEKKLREMQKAGEGVKAGTYLRSFMTEDDLHALPEFKELVDVILAESNDILNAYRVKRDSHYITGMWANITSPNRRHNTHVHQNCLFSGVVYIRTPPDCGRTVFYSPQHLTTALAPDLIEPNEFNAHTFGFPAEKGRMVIWQSHLPHAVDNGNANEDEDRIVVAFNIMIRGKIGMSTARMQVA